MGVGRFTCVLFPVLLTIGAIISMMVATLAGVVHNDLYLFRLVTEDLVIDSATIDNVLNNSGVDIPLGNFGDDINSSIDDAEDSVNDAIDDISDIGSRGILQTRQTTQTDNITAEQLGLGLYYDVTFWGYCYRDRNDERHCTDPEVNWASSALNDSILEEFGSPSGVRIELPDEVADMLRAFRELSRYTGIAFIIALIVLGVELVIGVLSNFSRVISCITYLIGILAIGITGIAASLATAQAVLVVGAVEATEGWYGAEAEFNGGFLAAVWIGFAFTLAASLFWLFTICCCKPESRSRKRGGSDGEKFLPPSAYRPLGDGHNDHEMTSGSGFYNSKTSAPSTAGPNFYPSQSPSQYGAPRGNARSDLAYEPYSHRV